MAQEIRRIKTGTLTVKVYETRALMGTDAAYDAGRKIKELLSRQEFVNIVFAAAPSQNDLLHALSELDGLDWNRINAFHMDEYVGLDKDHPASFGNFLKRKIFDRLPFHAIHLIDGCADDPLAECERYAGLLTQHAADIVCMGIGENTHLAFNDPHVADFNDPHMVKVIDLDEVSRRQQVHDKCFDHIGEVPRSAITLTIPALLKANSVYCVVPGRNKAPAVYHTLYEEVTERYPSTALRTHHDATLYLDKDSAERV